VRLALTAPGRQALRAAQRQASRRLRDVLRHGPDDGSEIDVGMVAAWLGDAVRRYDDERLQTGISTDASPSR